jgi:hypothetical protein
MPARRHLKADTIRVDTDASTIFYYNAYDRLGSVSQTLTDDRENRVYLTDKALDDLYEALKQREAHKQFLVAKYGENA